MADKESFSGPLTLEEIKWLLAPDKVPEILPRRATISEANPSRTIYSDSPTKDYLIKRQFFDNIPDELSNSFITEYLTPNVTLDDDESASTTNMNVTSPESIQSSLKNNNLEAELSSSSNHFDKADVVQEPNSSTPNRNLVDNNDKENISEQMSKASNLSSCHSSVYISARECSTCNLNKDVDSSNFSLARRNEGTSQCLNQMNDTTPISSGGDPETKNKGTNTNISDNECEMGQNFNNSSLYRVTSSDTDSSFEQPTVIQTDIVEQLKQSSLDQKRGFSEDINLEVHEPCTSITFNSELGNCHDSATNVLNVSISDTSEMVPSSLFQESTDYGFNDTLEEMEMALKHGLDYAMPDERSNTLTPGTPLPNCFEQHELLHSSIPKLSCTKLRIAPTTNKPKPNSAKSKKTLIPVRSPQTKTTPQKTITPIKSSFAKQDFNFKIPSKLTMIWKTPNFKGVLSPVAAYIKNSPKVPQIQRVSPKPVIAGSLFSRLPVSSVSIKRNEELPNRLYKPAKRTIVSEENDFKLPVSVEKYISNKLDIVKHHTRIIVDQTNPINVEEKLLKEDLTMCSTDASSFNSSQLLQDVSFHTTKKAFIH